MFGIGTLIGEGAGAFVGKIFGAIFGNPLVLGAIAVFIAYNVGYHLGARDTAVTMVTQLEKIDLENKIAKLEHEKAIAEAAAKQAESAKLNLDAMVAQMQGAINDYKSKLDAAGKSCPLDSDDMCELYGGKHCKSRKRKSTDRDPGVAVPLRADHAYGDDGRQACRKAVQTGTRPQRPGHRREPVMVWENPRRAA